MKKIWLSKQKGQDQITVREKDFQLGVDIFVDSFFLIAPIGITYLRYDLRPSIEDTTWMLFLPTISLYSKLRRLMMENMYQHAENMLMKERDKISGKMSTAGVTRKRKSIFGKEFNDKIAAVQNKFFSRRAKLSVFVFSLLYVMLLTAMIVVQIITLSSMDGLKCHTFIRDDEEAKKDWDEDCDDLIDSDLEEAAEATTQRWIHANTPTAGFRTESTGNKDSYGFKDGPISSADKPPSKDIISGYVNGVKNNKQKPSRKTNNKKQKKKKKAFELNLGDDGSIDF